MVKRLSVWPCLAIFVLLGGCGVWQESDNSDGEPSTSNLFQIDGDDDEPLSTVVKADGNDTKSSQKKSSEDDDDPEKKAKKKSSSDTDKNKDNDGEEDDDDGDDKTDKKKPKKSPSSTKTDLSANTLALQELLQENPEDMNDRELARAFFRLLKWEKETGSNGDGDPERDARKRKILDALGSGAKAFIASLFGLPPIPGTPPAAEDDEDNKNAEDEDQSDGEAEDDGRLTFDELVQVADLEDRITFDPRFKMHVVQLLEIYQETNVD